VTPESKRFCFCHLPILIVSVFLLLLAGGPAFAQSGDSCVTGKCHSGMGQAAYVHGPVAVGDCTFCHQPKLLGKHNFAPIENTGKLCADCHDQYDTKSVVHAPVREGQCTECHDPHQSPNRYQLRNSGSELCFQCHDQAMVADTFVHGPAAVGSCSTCHDIHQSEFPKMLIAEGNELCFGCHTEKADALRQKKFTHDPVREACVNCHDPHSGPGRYQLSADGRSELCFGCHADKPEEIASAAVKHGGLDTEKQCLACHDPHVSDYPKQLTRQPMALCLSCHDREYEKDAGTVANMKVLLANNAMHHGPVDQQDCSSCHNAHGSENFRMLREFFPPLFYAGYSANNYRLCFMCHEQTLADEETTTTLTGFRNGEQNLHFVHVNKLTRGRTCRACHDVHATNNPRHIRDAVPYARWDLPVGLDTTETGGSCMPGCHQQFAYDREQPVMNR
jgi:predicted CXXCH cytochrome family protein